MMKIKHWAYVGMVLAIGHESFLGGVSATELLQAPRPVMPPAFQTIRGRLENYLQEPQIQIQQPVLVRLFAARRLTSVTLKGNSDFILSGHRAKGPIQVSIRNGKLHIFQGSKRLFTTDYLKVYTRSNQPWQLTTPMRGERWVTGELRMSIVNERLKLVNRTELEDYVPGILEGELGTLALSHEVLKAQAVVARSYILSMKKERHPKEGFEFCDTPHCQVFLGVLKGPQAENLKGAMASVKGEYLAYKGKPICAFYHHNCGGRTSAVGDVWQATNVPYLRPVTEDARGVCRASPSTPWTIRLSKKRLEDCFRRAGLLGKKDSIKDIRIAKKDVSDRVQKVTLNTKKPVTITVGKFRNLVNQYYGSEVLKSALFTFSNESADAITVYGRGWGHGVGFCQEGAMWMARQKIAYEKILEHYFPQTKLKTL